MIMMIIFIIIGLVFMVSGAILIIRGSKRKSPEIMSEEFAELTIGCGEYDALVLDVHKESVSGASGGRKKQRVMILQIRFEEQKRTVIHKCTENFYGKYSRGERIRVFFREGSREDFCIPAEDNRFIKEKRFGGKMFIVSAGVVLFLMGLGLAGGAAAMLMK
ncbi:MAG: hypothetical protein K2K57_13655 [Oscillospiraceae bacterium]|nr:hypothetical protein [Oscillospiraceae bacterium]